MEFVNGWYILIIVSDVLTIVGSTLKMEIQAKVGKLLLSSLGLNLSEDFRLAVLASEWHGILELYLLLQNCNSCMLFLLAKLKTPNITLYHTAELSLLPVTLRNKM